MNKDILYQVIKDIYTKTNIYNRSALDFRVLVFNEKIRDLFNLYKNINDKVINLDKTVELINTYLGVSEIEKKKLGEVFTPFKLIDEMLDTLPVEVWNNPDLKWGDFANGISNFPIKVIQRLMVGLKDFEPDDELRYKHIIENMIYMCDIQPKNNFITTQLLGGIDKKKFNLNLYGGSFLEEGFDKHMNEVWGVDKFDIIMGNPPYNSDGGLKTGGKNLYQKFILKSLDIYNKYILFVTPPGFYKTTNFDEPNNIFKKLCNNNSLLYLNDSNVSKKYFSVGTLIVYYLISKERYQGNTLIENEYGKFKIDISKFNFIPRIVTPLGYSILNKLSTIGERMVIYRDDKQLKKVNSFVTLSTLNHLNKSGHWNVSVGNKDNRKRIIIEHESPDDVIRILNLKLYRYAFYTYRHDGAVYHNFLIGFRIPKNIVNINNDKDLYDYFGLSPEEVDLVENTIE